MPLRPQQAQTVPGATAGGWPTAARPVSGGPSGPRRTLLTAGRTLMALLAVTVLVGTGAAYKGYHDVLAGVTTSQALDDGPKSANADQNILVMGLDSRLDEKGNPLPQDIYDALHAGDDSVGGYNSNVLILLHIPGDGSKSTAISIPRDDYVALDPSACDVAPCKGKIKQAYGYAYERAKVKLENAKTVTDPVTIEQKSRDAGRKAEIATVRTFLGGNVPIDHFVEVTLVAFFQIAQAVQPLTVCLNERTQDDFSGADFKKGRQEIDAAQAMAFVRQRRDPDPSLNFTDLDRTRRQQAFIVSLARKLSNTGAVASPSTLHSLLDVAKQNIAVDSTLDLVAFAQRASQLMSGGITLYTLPVKDFGTDDLGEDINLVDLSQIHAIAKSLLSGGSVPTTAVAPTTVFSAAGVVVNVINGSGQTGLAARLEQALTGKGFTQGTVGTGTIRSVTTLSYGSGADAAATSLAETLGLTATKSAALDPDTIQLIVGTDGASSGPIAELAASIPDTTYAATTTSGGSAATSTEPPAPVSATATGVNAPEPTDLSSMDGGDIPCVK
ncbi:LytR family transcriptional regulator [Nocardia stercoris]|uniref:LytR family transcriptional regulator n=2 Tax=Nocardia stercoris TaxID=2483361 RepID=A0A3M2L932_9NOCA|nr:LytR family transcriptional regulator [Nocardia stercoris]